MLQCTSNDIAVFENALEESDWEAAQQACRHRGTEVRSLRASNEDFQLAVFDTQSGTGLPVPFGTAIKTNPESLNELAFVPAEEPAPVYMSM